jgi:hypothetical protein
MLDFGEPGATAHIAQDINPLVHGSWCWTIGPNPTLKILTPDTQNLKLAVDFAFWDEGFRQTGPVELTFIVNQGELATVRYDTPGNKHFEQAVPAKWLSTDVEATVSVRTDKLYVSPSDGKKFGFILSRIGFTR